MRTPPAVLAVLPLVLACGSRAAPPSPVAPAAERPSEAPAEQPGAEPAWEASGVDWAQPPAPGPEPEFQPPRPIELRLNSGLRVLVVENRRLPLVSLRLVNPAAGATRDPQGKSGLAGLTADLLDESAGARSAVELANELERLGAHLTAYAGAEATTIGLDTLSSTLEDSLALWSDVVAAPRFTEADFRRIKADRLSYVRRRADEPRSVAALVFDRVLFGEHPYGRSVLGTARSLGAIRRADVQRFYRDNYGTAAMTLVVAGDVDAAALAPVLERVTARWPRGKASQPARLAAPPARRGPHRLVLVDKPGTPQSVVTIGRASMPRQDARYFPATVANAVLGGSFSSRLNHRLREQLGYTYGAGSSFFFGRVGGSWSARASLHADKTADGIREALALIESMRAAPVPAAELDKAKQLLIRQLPQSFETNAGIAGAYADLVLHQLPLDWYERYRAGIEAIDDAAALAFATGHFVPDDLVVIVVGDLAQIRGDLEALGLGPALQVDTEGTPVPSGKAP